MADDKMSPFQRIKGILSSLVQWILLIGLVIAVLKCRDLQKESQISQEDAFKTALLETVANAEQTSLSFFWVAILSVNSAISTV